MTNSADSLRQAQTAFDESLRTLEAENEAAAVVVLTMARLALQELSQNAEFAAAVRALHSPSASVTVQAPGGSAPPASAPSPSRRTRIARTPASIDPFDVLRKDGPDGLVTALNTLQLEQLRDIIHQYGMDPDKRAMKWKTASKVRDRIVERALATSSRDNAFR